MNITQNGRDKDEQLFHSGTQANCTQRVKIIILHPYKERAKHCMYAQTCFRK